MRELDENDPIYKAIDTGGGQTCNIQGVVRELAAAGYVIVPADENERLRAGLDAAIRAADLALFVIRKQGIMPNSSWQRGFEKDMATANAARAVNEKGPRPGVSQGGELDVRQPAKE
jgi:hypothetical protein